MTLRPIIPGYDRELQTPYYYKNSSVITTNLDGSKAGTYKMWYYKSDKYDSFGSALWRIGTNIILSSVAMPMSWVWGNYYMTDMSDEVTSTCAWSETITVKALNALEVELGVIGVITYGANQVMKRKPVTFITDSDTSFALVDGTYAGPLVALLIETTYTTTVTGSKAVPPGYLYAAFPTNNQITPSIIL